MTSGASLDAPDAPAASPELDDVVSQFTGRALTLARRILGDDNLADDVVQEAFVAYWRNPAAFDPARGSLASWVLTLVHHKAVDAVRHQESHRRRAMRLLDDLTKDRQAGADDAADTTCDHETGTAVRAALRSLPYQQREALILAYWGGLSQSQIATLTGAPLGTVKSRTLVAIRQLRRALESDAYAGPHAY